MAKTIKLTLHSPNEPKGDVVSQMNGTVIPATVTLDGVDHEGVIAPFSDPRYPSMNGWDTSFTELPVEIKSALSDMVDSVIIRMEDYDCEATLDDWYYELPEQFHDEIMGGDLCHDYKVVR